MKEEELARHRCEPNERWMEFDARGIELGFVCGECRASKLSKYRPDVLLDPNYPCDEDVDPEPSVLSAEEEAALDWDRGVYPSDFGENGFLSLRSDDERALLCDSRASEPEQDTEKDA